MKYLIGVFCAFLLLSSALADECYYELSRLENQIAQLQSQLSEPIDETPCKVFGLFGDVARKMGEKSGDSNASLMSELMYGIENFICKQEIKEKVHTQARLEQLRKQYMRLRRFCYGY